MMKEKEIQKLFEKALSQVKEAGIEVGDIKTPIKTNNRFKRTWGMCRKRKNNGEVYFLIEISPLLLEADEKHILTTIVHEILHAAKGAIKHGHKWQEYARIMNNKYGYKISRITSVEEKGLSNDAKKNAKHIIRCKNENCKTEYFYYRDCKRVSEHHKYRCHICKSPLEKIK